MKLLIILSIAAIVYSVNSASINKRDARDDLLTKAADLEKKANDEIKKLTAAGKKEDAAALEKEEKALQKLATELKAATDAAEIKRLDTEVTAAEKKIEDDLKRLAGNTSAIVKRDARDDLLTKAADLEKKANDEIKKLTAAGKKEDAAALEKEEKALQKLAAELKAATDAAEIKRLDTEVMASEKKIEDDLKRLAGNPSAIVKRDARDDLLTKAATIEKNVEAAITKLTADGNTAEVAVLKEEEKKLKTLATELKAATEAAAITRLEGEVKASEDKIAAELRKATKGSTTKAPAF